MAMDERRYRDIGFMCGLEIHQRLDTDSKLFCSCPAEAADSKAIGTVYRNQRAVAGELGEMDPSAEFEERRKRRFAYRVGRSDSCLVEIDEEPPHGINSGALAIALSVAKALSIEAFDELEPMRKEVVDGSNPSAFQRTMMLGMDGRVNANGIEIRIPSIFLEEESASIDANNGMEIEYGTGRLGIPLIEIDTSPDIPTPEAAREIALHIGMLLRMTGRVKRGIGTIRQDVNVSIRGGARVEIKGLQEVRLMNRFIENEITRQQKLLEIADSLRIAGAEVLEPVDVTGLFRGTKVSIIRNMLDRGGIVLGFGLRGFAGLLGREVNPNRRLGSEISDYAKSAGSNGIIHSDEDMARYGFFEVELVELRKALGIDKSGSFMLVAESRLIAPRAIAAARRRALLAMEGVPKETRSAVNDEACISKFIRPLPGGSRMYPETDILPIRITPEMRKRAAEEAPDLDGERAMLAKQLSDKNLVEQMLKSPRLGLYREIVGGTHAEPRFVANVLLQKFTELSRSGLRADAIPDARLLELFGTYADNKITKQGLEAALKRIAAKDADLNSVIEEEGLSRITGRRLRELVDAVRAGGTFGDKASIRDSIMAKHRLNVDGEELNSLL